MRCFSESLTWRDPALCFQRFAAHPYSLFFDSADRNHPNSRYSFIAFDPDETITAKNGIITWRIGGQKETLETCPFSFMQERLAAQVVTSCMALPQDLPPFSGGAAGYFGYDLARGLEHLPDSAKDNPDMPDMALGIYNKILAFDHKARTAHIIVRARDEDAAHNVFAACRARLSGSGDSPAEFDPFAPSWRRTDKQARYEDKVRRVIDYIHAGDVFQANLSHRFSADLPENFDAYSYYRRLRDINPAPFAGFMNFGDTILASASPERFLYVKNGRVETCPIKGTRPRHNDLKRDAVIRKQLTESEKDRAENIMIVDLMRNDLSKVCRDDSVSVPSLCALESFAGVHHLVSTVTGQLRPDKTALDLLKACFPGGSVTGAPKIRAMEIIEELEDIRRGPYCGAMGYIGYNGAMDTNIAIRTLVCHKGEVSFNVGGGIVADSDPASEYRETLDKAEKLLRSFAGEQKQEDVA